MFHNSNILVSFLYLYTATWKYGLNATRLLCWPEKMCLCGQWSFSGAAGGGGAKAGPPQLEPEASLLERETSDSTEATARQSSFSSFI